MADNKANHNSMNHLSGRRGNLHKLIKAEMMTGYKLRLPLPTRLAITPLMWLMSGLIQPGFTSVV
jgi:hypothetical protein